MALPIAYIVIITVSTCLGHNESSNNFLMNEGESLVRPKSRWWAKTNIHSSAFSILSGYQCSCI